MSEDRFDDRICAVCRRPATGIGYAPTNFKRLNQIAWLCDDLECQKIAAETYSMRQTEFNRLDTMATLDGGNEGGAYLDSIGKTDLASLNEGEWETFLKRVVGGYRAALKGRLRDEAPF